MANPSRRPTQHYVREAVNAHHGRDITSTTVIQWVRREHGVSLNQSSTSGALTRLVGEHDAFVLTRVALGLYHVEAARLASTTPVEPSDGPLNSGDLLEVVHVTRHGIVWATSEDGSLFRVSAK